MYKICIPIENNHYDPKAKESLVRELKRANPDLVYLVFSRVLCNDAMLREITNLYQENKKFLEDNGFRIGAWLAPTIGYGSEHWGDNGAQKKFTLIQSIDGSLAKSGFCPLDDHFVAEFLKLITTIAKTGVKDILFEDEFTLTGGQAVLLGCCCEKHREEYCRMIGEELSREELKEKVIVGGRNKYRDAWVALMGKTLCDFAAKIEKAVHVIAPDIRIGLSANASSYSMEGVSLPTLAKIIAGKNKPLIRMTGAPYWSNAATLGPNIDTIRVQEHWCGDEIELLTEGDTYPRPRLWVPSAYLECYDMILRAEGKSAGILKYMMDYHFHADYETGYVDSHVRNQMHYGEIEKRFAGKEPTGLNVFEKELLLADEEFGDEIQDLATYKWASRLPLVSQRFLSDNAIPTAYGDKKSASIVFGANAHHVDDALLQRGVILDAEAAKILTNKGIDVGIHSYQKTGIPIMEHYFEEDEYAPVRVVDRGVFYDFVVDDKAQVMSEFIVRDGAGGFAGISPYDKSGTRIPACYRYENAKGQRFLVYTFVAPTVWSKSEWTPGIFRNYYRQKQLTDGISWLQGRRLPAMCLKHPQAYILCKKDEISMTVGIWNLFADTMYTPEVILDRSYRRAEFYQCKGSLDKEKMNFTTDIPPYGFAIITLYQ